MHVNIHPGSGKSLLLSMLSVGLFTATKLRVYACASRKKKIYLTFYAFSRSLQQQNLSHAFPECMCIQETENLLFMLSVGLYTNKVTRKSTCIQETENLLYSLWLLVGNKVTRLCMCIQESKPHVTLSIFSYRSKTTLRVNVHPGNGKSRPTFYTLNTPAATKLRVGVHPGRGKPVHVTFNTSSRSTSMQETENLHYFAHFIRPIIKLSNIVTRLCMFIQETENLLYFLCFQ